ncbi:DNA primase small subunit [Pancytospora epiphaga]|nr:DNA primase small subunit [Pancytospora epiphaga]
MNQRELLKKYYSEIFPVEELFEVLGISEFREMSFTTQQDAYVRYLSFSNSQEFKEKVAEINPKKIDVGAIHDGPIRRLGGAKPVERELVFDIDLTDYPRTCCDGKSICERCFEKIKCAIKILDYSLKEEFGFRSVGFVFSGRRGVHCWVLDHKDMNQQVRGDIYKFYQQIIEKNQFVEAYDKIMREFCDDDKNIIQEWFIRIDKQVTVNMNHLIKAPFSVHADTLNISLPIDPQEIWEYKDILRLGDVVENPALLLPHVKVFKGWKNTDERI